MTPVTKVFVAWVWRGYGRCDPELLGIVPEGTCREEVPQPMWRTIELHGREDPQKRIQVTTLDEYLSAFVEAKLRDLDVKIVTGRPGSRATARRSKMTAPTATGS